MPISIVPVGLAGTLRIVATIELPPWRSSSTAAPLHERTVASRKFIVGEPSKKRKRFRELFIDGAGSRRPVLLPPSNGLFDMCVGSFSEPNPHSSPAAAGQLFENFFGRNRFTPVRLGDRQEQFSLVLRRQRNASVFVPRQHCHGRTLFQRCPLYDHLPTDHFSSSDSHTGKDAPIPMRALNDVERPIEP